MPFRCSVSTAGSGKRRWSEGRQGPLQGFYSVRRTTRGLVRPAPRLENPWKPRTIAATGRGTLPTVPIDAILEADGDRASVFVVSGERARRRAVRLATIRGDRVAVREGLDDARHVVVSGASYLDDGAAVRVLP